MAIQISTDGLEASTATDDLRSLHRKSLAILKRLQTHAMDPETGEKAGPTFPISKAAELVDRTASAIREAERDGRLPERGRTPSGHRLPYNLTELDHMRKVFGTRRWRDTADTPAFTLVRTTASTLATTTPYAAASLGNIFASLAFLGSADMLCRALMPMRPTSNIVGVPVF